MIRAAFSSLAGAWIARNVEQGEIPERFAVPLTLLASRLPARVILAGAIGYGLYRLNQEARAMTAKDVTPKRRVKATASRAKPASRRTRRNAKRQNSGESEPANA